MLKGNKTVFFDLGNVLLFFSHEKMFRQLGEVCEIDEKEVQQFLSTENLADRYERGCLDSRAMHHLFCKKTNKQLPFSKFMKAASDIFEPNIEIVPIVKKLKENNTRLIILSNTCEAHFAFAFCHYPIIHLFDHYILSYEVGSRKPESLIFAHALSRAESPIENCFYTDDVAEYIHAAKKEGLDGEVFSTAGILKKQLMERGFL
jgi:FMN phosphatase YigB (HAD superfamily)